MGGITYSRWTSRKFLMTVAGVLVFIASEFLGVDLDPVVLLGLLTTIGGFVAGESYLDRAKVSAFVADRQLNANDYVKYLEEALAKFSSPVAETSDAFTMEGPSA